MILQPAVPRSPVNILLLDDTPAKLLTYEVILSELGENLIKATSADEAFQILLKIDVALVLTDVSMPSVDGFEFAKNFARTSSVRRYAYRVHIGYRAIRC